ncbi:NADH:flavin oxidoreductase [Kiloniella sp. b19]|uniref:NADH:flavin oxidoreductase n=1 Tax=Kiloniella sp. GXU_MW_B19 TaxID=3141326 RepID=UPI0031D20A59
MSHPVLFSPSNLGSLPLKNRTLVAPMTRISALPSGEVGPLMSDYYKAFADGGFAAVITEGVYTDELYSQGYRNQSGIANQTQAESWKPLIRTVQESGAKVIMQLMHAGALSQHNRFSSETAAPSAFQPMGEQLEIYHGKGGYALPKALSADDIKDVVQGFTDAARRAQDAGVDGLEIHGANGYLLDQFATDYSNLRSDHYGGSVANRIRLTCEITAAVREAAGKDFTLGVRISQAKVNNYDHRWAGAEDDAKLIFSGLAEAGASFLHTTEHHGDQPAFGQEGGQTLAALAKAFSGLPVIANGKLDEPDRAEALLAAGKADFVSIGKAALAAPDWPERVLQDRPRPEFDFGLLSPIADIGNSLRFHNTQS